MDGVSAPIAFSEKMDDLVIQVLAGLITALIIYLVPRLWLLRKVAAKPRNGARRDAGEPTYGRGTSWKVRPEDIKTGLWFVSAFLKIGLGFAVALASSIVLAGAFFGMGIIIEGQEHFLADFSLGWALCAAICFSFLIYFKDIPENRVLPGLTHLGILLPLSAGMLIVALSLGEDPKGLITDPKVSAYISPALFIFIGLASTSIVGRLFKKKTPRAA